MSTDSSTSDSNHCPNSNIYARSCYATELAIDYAWDICKPDHHWNGELKANSAITAQQIFFYQSLGLTIPDAAAYRQYLLCQQQGDGSWAIAPDYPGDVSISAETYLALRILGVSSDDPAMKRGRAFIRKCGGIAKVRIFTRIFFAQFGLFPWSAVPQLPAEFILLPSILPINIYRMSSWARSTLVPLLIIRHHEKVYALPNGLESNNTFLDELWLNPADKYIPFRPSILKPWKSDIFSVLFSAIDAGLAVLGKVRPLWMFRRFARKKCVQWILDHQEKEGDWAGIIPPMHFGLLALLLEGYNLQDDCVRRGLDAIERFTWHDDEGKRLQSCISPVWDTVLMARGLCDAGVGKDNERIRGAIKWIKSKQILERRGDWKIFARAVQPGGFSFEYHNDWYPDVDDTAAAILAVIVHDPAGLGSTTVAKAATWICGMQNRDGGWGAFDIDNDKLWLNKIPFSDMNALCDPSSADVTGRILEAFGLIMKLAEREYVEPQVLERISLACNRAITYLIEEQEKSGAWYGRWGSNYLYGTSNVICGLVYFSAWDEQIQDMLSAATNWLKRMQNADGGWGEDLLSYQDTSRAGKGPSTPSQTAWALMGLLATCDHHDEAIEDGVVHLLETQTDVQGRGASWPEWRYTGTGFPNHFYIGYSLYRHYFPLMALGRYVRAVDGAASLVSDTSTPKTVHSCSRVDSAYEDDLT
ncbi:putative squalene-hopene-cyclase [Dendryphion nanum]|uniref:Terpene cyclase/mutase family member n=1 Tax=Dendryphion nanum TaxID=256645 RepID=A0A9P9EIW5_9PLEO|nr:putative squalene-hopene-cyclase [Dendryphion nanum]